MDGFFASRNQKTWGDEYVFVVTPVVAGAGKLLFKDVKQFGLKPLSTKSFKSGNILLHAETVKSKK